MILSLILGLFSTGLSAAEKNFEAAKKPSLTLNKSDLSVIEKATQKNFKGLSTKEKELLLKYLKDYAKSAKHQKNDAKSDMKKGKKDPVKPKKPVKMLKKVSKK
tara:strand:- start:70 stop:381 length:312 start_codon:yes stop_codon:yes gene_type:complete